MNENYQKIETLLLTVRRRRRRRERLRLLLLGLAVLFALVGLAGLEFPQLSGWLRLLFRAAFLLTLAATAGAFAYALWRKRETIDSAALAVEAHNPWLKNALINAAQLYRAFAGTGTAAVFSRDFLAQHLETTAAQLSRIDLVPVLSRASLKKPALVAGILAAAFALQLGINPGRTGRALVGIVTEPWSAPQAELRGAALPLTAGDFTLSYFFPTYSGIEAQTVAHTNGNIAALRGASVKIETRVLEPLRSAALITSGGAHYEMTVSNQTLLAAELVLSETGTYHIEGVDTDGRRRSEPGSHQMVADDDLPPEIVMLTPAGDVEVAAEGTLEITWQAADDFGLREIALVYQRNGKEEKLALKSFQDDGRTRLSGNYSLVLSDIKAKSGERIPFCLEALDNDEVAGGKTGRSETRILEVFSARKQHRELLARQDEFLNMMIDHLASHLAAEIGLKQPGFDLVVNEQKLLAEAVTLVAVLQELLRDVHTDEFKVEILEQALEDMAARYPARLAERSALLGKGSALAEPQRGKLLAAREQYRGELENDILYLDKLIKKQRVDDLLTEADDLYKARADLSELIAEYRRTGDPMLLEKFQKAMAELQSAFESLQKRMAEMRKELPEEFVNADALDKANMMDLASEMEKLRQALVDGDMESAMAMAEKFLSQMGDWMSSLEKSAVQLGEAMSAETMAKLNEVSARLDDMIKRQTQVEDGLQEIYQRAMEQSADDAATQKLREEIDQALRSFQQAASESQNNFLMLQSQTPDGKPKPMSREQGNQRTQLGSRYSGLRNAAEEIRKAVAAGDLDRALQLAQDLENLQAQTRKSSSDLLSQIGAGPPPLRQAFNGSSDRADTALKEALAKMKNLKGALEFSLDASSRAELDELSRVQEELRSDAQQTLESYEELRQEAPSLPGNVSQHLDQAAFQMHDASGEMALGDPGRALVPAAGARMHLEQAAASLAKARQQMSKGMGFGMGMPGMMPGGQSSGGRGNGFNPNERVEIPDKDAYQVPEQYREELLKAMKEGSPEAYKNLNRDYYERLVH